jgi:L-fucose isomerase-like protein
MEIQQLEPRLEDTQEEYVKAQKFKEYVQGIFIENNSQEEFKRRVDAIFNETFKDVRL